MADANWMSYRDPNADVGFENNKITGGALPETMPEPKYQMGAGNMHENMFATLPKSQREAAQHMGMKMDPRYTDDVKSIEDSKTGDEQAQDMMDNPIPVGSEHYIGESEE